MSIWRTTPSPTQNLEFRRALRGLYAVEGRMQECTISLDSFEVCDVAFRHEKFVLVEVSRGLSVNGESYGSTQVHRQSYRLCGPYRQAIDALL